MRVIIFLFICSMAFSQDVIGKIGNTEFIKYKDMLGYKIDNVYLLTGSNNSHNNIRDKEAFYKWYIYVKCNETFQKVDEPVSVCTDYDYYTDILKYTVITDFWFAYIRNLRFSVKRDELLKLLNIIDKTKYLLYK